MQSNEDKEMNLKSVWELCSKYGAIIPPCQRPYCWNAMNIQQLLDDIDELRQDVNTQGAESFQYTEDDYYLGSICFFQKEGTGPLEVYDGQQRLTSLLILASVLNKKPTDELFEKFSYSLHETQQQIAAVHRVLNARYIPREEKTNQKELVNARKKQDELRFDYLLNHAIFSVTILRSEKEAEQFFQGENNRGEPMRVADLLKAFHLRHIQDKTLKTEALKIWASLDPNRLRRLIFPILLLPRGGWHRTAGYDKLENVEKLKGMMPSIRNNRLVDSKINPTSSAQKPVPDIMQIIQPGFEFFSLLKHVDRLLNAVSPNESFYGDFGDLYQMAQVYWLDRFCLRSDYEGDKDSDKKLKELVKNDLAFCDYVDQLNAHFSIIRKNYGRLFWKSICGLFRLDAPVVCPLLSPYRSATPLQCTQLFDQYWDGSDYWMNWRIRGKFLNAIQNYRLGLPYDYPKGRENGQ